MITTIKQDILKINQGVIVHSVNCIGVVGGLAGAIARKWPKNADEYRAHVKRQRLPIVLLGNIFEVNVAHNIIVANLFGQNRVGTGERQTEYAALISGFKRVADTSFYGNEVIEKFFHLREGRVHELSNLLQDIYIPYKIGCGLGGADWSIVEKIIEEVFDKSGKNVYICNNE